MPCSIKICGLSEEITLRAAIASGADYIGFVHHEKSPRHLSIAQAAELKKQLPSHVKSVLVVVNPDDALLADIITIISPDYIQLHGGETPARIAQIHKKYPAQKLIKAISVSKKENLMHAKAFEPLVDILLFDAASTQLPGGNGISFDWGLLAGFSSPLPWILSGGLTAENIHTAIAQSGALIVDVSSGVESKRGIKDAAKIQQFIHAAQQG